MFWGCLKSHVTIPLAKASWEPVMKKLMHFLGLLANAPTNGIGTPDPNPRHLVNWCLC